MPVTIEVEFDSRELAALSDKRIRAALKEVMRKAGSSALRDMSAEARKRVRVLERIKVGIIGKAFRLRMPKGNELDGGEWSVDVRGSRVSLMAYPVRQTKRGVSVEVAPGKRFLIPHAFVATLTKGGQGGGGAGHRGVFNRKGKLRLPIREILGSRPLDALMRPGQAEAVQQRGARSIGAAFPRLMKIELDKGNGG